MRLENQVAIVTGAASGIGKAMAQRFGKEGSKLVLADINEDALGSVVAEVTEAGGTAVAYAGNLVDPEVAKELIEKAVSEYGQLNILCNNAGVLDKLTPVADLTDEMWDLVMGVNAKAPMMTCRSALPIMIEQGAGIILNTASVAASSPGCGGAAYTASKHAILGLTKSIAWFYGDKGIRCNAMSPGAIMTPMAMSKTHPAGMEKMAPYLPIISRYADPGEVADAALFLVSDEAKYLNGSNLTVDGGWTLF